MSDTYDPFIRIKVGYLYRHGLSRDFIQTYRFIVQNEGGFYPMKFLECGRYNKVWKLNPDNMYDHIENYYAMEVEPSILKPIQKYNLIKAIMESI